MSRAPLKCSWGRPRNQTTNCQVKVARTSILYQDLVLYKCPTYQASFAEAGSEKRRGFVDSPSKGEKKTC